MKSVRQCAVSCVIVPGDSPQIRVFQQYCIKEVSSEQAMLSSQVGRSLSRPLNGMIKRGAASVCLAAGEHSWWAWVEVSGTGKTNKVVKASVWQVFNKHLPELDLQ